MDWQLQKICNNHILYLYQARYRTVPLPYGTNGPGFKKRTINFLCSSEFSWRGGKPTNSITSEVKPFPPSSHVKHTGLHSTENLTYYWEKGKLPVFPIRIHLIRIRIQHFRLNTVPIRIQGFDDQNIKKNYNWKFFLYFLDKNFAYS